MRFLTPIALLSAFTTAQNNSTPVPPKMTLLYSMEAFLGDRFSLGAVPYGQNRVVIPIVGGTFKGPRMSGEYPALPSRLHMLAQSQLFNINHHVLLILLTLLLGKVLNLGADWRLTDAQGGIRPDTRYAIQTDDGTNVLIQTEGPTPNDAGNHSILRAKFETGANGTYAWLNDVVAVGILTRSGTEKVFIDMWHVSIGGEI